MGASYLLLQITPEVAKELAVAILRHRNVADVDGREVPDALEDLQWQLVELAKRASVSNAQERSGALTPDEVLDDSPVRSEYLTTKEAAREAGLSAATIRRRIADDSLPSTKVGGSRRIYRPDLEAFMSGGSS